MAEQHNYASDLVDLLGSFTDNGRSLRSFINHPQELAICVLTAGLMANSKLLMPPEDAIKASFDIYSRIQRHVAAYQNMQFAATVEDAFKSSPESGRPPGYPGHVEHPPETEGD
jgi:hypothetical protein